MSVDERLSVWLEEMDARSREHRLHNELLLLAKFTEARLGKGSRRKRQQKGPSTMED